MIDFKIIPTPDDQWLTRLRQGNYVWLSKEKQYAQIEMPWYPPEPGYVTGKIAFSKFCYDRYVGYSVWYVSSDGRGIDGSRIMDPLEGNVPENPDPVEEKSIMELRREIAILNRRVDILEMNSRLQNYNYPPNEDDETQEEDFEF